MISYDIAQLLLLTIIGSSKNGTTLIVAKEDIKVNKLNRLLVYPYSHDHTTGESKPSQHTEEKTYEGSHI